MSSKEFDLVCQKVLEEIVPDPAEVELLNKITNDIVDAILKCSKGYSIVDALPGGSFAKGTFLAGNTDLDIFVRLKTNTKKDLESFAENNAKCIAKKIKCEYKIAYAENPYIHVTVNRDKKKIEADIVPIAYAKDTSQLKSALEISGMARTPFHTMYALKKLDDKMRNEVRLLKYFAKQKRIYGVFGFTGWICELLILHYKKFKNVIKHFEDFSNLAFDLEKRYTPRQLRKKFPNDKIIILDPIDPDRNAAAGIQGFVGEMYIKRFMREAKRGLESPSTLFEKVDERGNIEITFKLKPEVGSPIKETILTSLGHIVNVIQRNVAVIGYTVADVYLVHDPIEIVLEVKPFDMPYQIKVGPPVRLKTAVKRFMEKNKDGEFFIKDNRYYAKVPSKYPTAIDAVTVALKLARMKIFESYEIKKGSKK